MNKLIKNKFNIILGIFILLHPIIDLITGISLHVFNFHFTFGNIIRVIFLIFVMYTTVFVYKNKKSFIYYLICGVYFFLYVINCIVFKDGVGLFSEIQGLIRTFYFPLILISLYEIKEEIKINKMLLVTTLGVYLVCIFLPIIFGIGYQSYEVTKSGTLGFYNSANEISGIISILTPIVFILFKEKRKLFAKLLFILMYLIVIVSVGTKTPLLSLLITIGMLFMWIIVRAIKKKEYKSIIYMSLIIFVGIVALLITVPKTNFYKNIKVHLDFLDVDNIVDILKDEELIDHFIFSQRLTFWNNRENVFEDSNIFQKLIGIGYLEDGKLSKLVEMDYIDIYYCHGVIGFIIFFSGYFCVLVKIFKEKIKINFDKYMTMVSFILIIFLSLFTGHIITAPAVSLIVIMIILELSNKNKKQLLFTINTLDIGGIEKAIVNLLNNIDYKKYNVTLVMEEKKGILLPLVNENVKIIELPVSNNSNVFIRKAINFGRKLWFSLYNYNVYDFSCCYATYSLSGNKISRIASKNNALYIHSNYKYAYDEENMKNFFNTRAIDEFKRLIFVSNEAKNDFIEFYPQYKEKSFVANNFIDYEKILLLSKENISIKKDKDKKLFVFVGRLDESSKKLSRAINLVREIKNIELWVVGDGPDRKTYEDLVEKYTIEERVKFLGSKENPYPYVKVADYIILTSDYEGFPVIYLESIVLQKPIITTIDVSDDKINVGKDFATIISKDENKIIKEIKDILNEGSKNKKVDFQQIQKERMKKLEKIFDDTI